MRIPVLIALLAALAAGACGDRRPDAGSAAPSSSFSGDETPFTREDLVRD